VAQLSFCLPFGLPPTSGLEVYGPYVVTPLDGHLYINVLKLDTKKTIYNKIGLYAYNLDTMIIVAISTTQMGGLTYVIAQRKKIVNSTSYTFCISTPILKLETTR
jgi:hypothetical protein